MKNIHANPVKFSIYGSLGVSAYVFCKTNPDEKAFVDQLRKAQNQISLVGTDSQNPTSVNYLKMLERNHQNYGTLRITSIGLFSIMWLDDSSENLSSFDAKCEYLKPELRTFHERIIDVGLLNNWWNLEKQMKDYDINF